MQLVIGCDEAAYRLKIIIENYLNERYPSIKITDIGANKGEEVLYPDIAYQAAKGIKQGKYDRGILLCGTGIGMSISANKVKGVRAAVCHDPFSAERSRKSNNAQILCMGERIIGVELAKCIVDIWMNSEFSGGNSEKKVNRICELEEKACFEMHR